jgi:pimeloyl-ACP methyl ester carboxylesterase
MQRARRAFLIAIVAVIILYAGVCGLVFAFQRSLIYYPRPRTNSEAGTLITFPVGTETVNVTARPFAGPDAVLYFGGNAEDVSRDMPDMEDTFPHRAIYLLHYPGYGGSSGSPSQQAIFADALALFDRVHAEHPNVVVIGRSLGTGVAVWIAGQKPVVRLVLVTPYDSLADAAAQQYPFLPVRWLLRDKFESWRYAPQVTAPTRMIVAEDDEIIPRSSSDRLRTRFKNTTVSYIVVSDAGHNSIQDKSSYWTLLRSDDATNPTVTMP